ncbi:VanZ family protein [Streptomyces sp. SBR177]
MFVLLATIIALSVGTLRFRVARSRESERPALHALLAAAVTAVVSLTLWSTGSPTEQSRICIVNSDITEPLTTSQGLLNAGLFLPVGLLGVLATRNVLGTFIGGFLLTASIETAQATLTFLGRGCDTSDLLMNTLGVAAGAAIGWAVTRIDDSEGSVRLLNATRRLTTVWLGSAALLTGLWVAFIHPEKVAYTVAVVEANEDQQGAVREAVASAFGNHFKINSIDFARGPSGDAGTVLANLDAGLAELSWPDRRTFKASLDVSSGNGSTGYPLGGNPVGHPNNAQAAQALARSYAKDHAPWALGGTEPVTSPVGAKAEMGWMTSWRRHNKDGVMMPMRLDIQVDRFGAMTQLIMRDIGDPTLPTPQVTREEAARMFRQAAEVDAGSPVDLELVAKSVDDEWKIHWLAFGQIKGGSGLAVIDAEARNLISFSSQPAGVPIDEVVGEATQ